MLGVLSFGTDRNLTAYLHQMCAWMQDIHIYRSLEHYPHGHEALRLLNSFVPQLVFLGVDDEIAAATAEQDIRGILPRTAILGVFAGPGNAGWFETARGCFPMLALPCAPEDFRAATVDALHAQTVQKNAEVFGFLPAKAGSGATTTALFVADILSKRARQKVLLLECDLHAGPVSMLYNRQPRYSILDVLENSASLNEANWKDLVSRMDDFDVLPSTGRIGARKASAWGYQSLLSFVRSRYDIVLADLPETIDDATEFVVRAAKGVFVVTAPSTPSLYLASRRRHDLEARGVATAKVKFVVNRMRHDQPLPHEAGWPIDSEKLVAIPFDDNLLDACEFRSSLARSATIAGFAKIAEVCGGVSFASEAEPRKSWLQGWMRGPSGSLAHSTR
jgi:MinD-like ATPase involved in chromosome partitioning or flagellar assembly